MSVVRRGKKFAIRYYGPDGRQRWETIGPNRKEAETILHQRLYETRLGKYPVLQRRTRMGFRDFVAEWERRHLVRVRDSTARLYKRLLARQLLPVFGDRALNGIKAADVEAFVADASAQWSPKTVNNALGLLKQLLVTAVEWGYLTASPIATVKKLRRPRRDLPLWTPAEIRRFLLAAPAAWRPVWIVAVFTGLRPGEIQAMAWTGQNWPDFAANKLHVTCAYESVSKVLGAPKTDRSVRNVDLVPTVREALRDLPNRAAGSLVFPGAGGGMFARSNLRRAWAHTITAAKVRPIRPYDLRHTFASLLVAAGKNPLYIARQMGHYSAGFTLDTYGHLMESVPRVQVEWIDELVFPEGFPAGRVRDRRVGRSDELGNSALSISVDGLQAHAARRIAYVSDPFSSNRTCGATASGSRTEFTPGSRSDHSSYRPNWCSPYS